MICFSATAGILALSFLGNVVQFAMTHMGAKTTPLDAPLNYLELAMIFFSAGLPVGAALAGIRVHGDFEGSKQRSDKMLEVLAALKDDYKAATNHEISLDETAELLLTATRAMSEDVSAWQELVWTQAVDAAGLGLGIRSIELDDKSCFHHEGRPDLRRPS